MKTYTTKNIRNVVLLGSSKSGKTTLAEAMLYISGASDRLGKVGHRVQVHSGTEYNATRGPGTTWQN